MPKYKIKLRKVTVAPAEVIITAADEALALAKALTHAREGGYAFHVPGAVHYEGEVLEEIPPSPREQAETAAVEQYEKHKGQLLLVKVVQCTKDYDAIEVHLDTPALARVCETDELDVKHWTDGEHLDPRWTIQMLEDVPPLHDVTSTWVHGYTVHPGGEVDRSSVSWVRARVVPLEETARD